MTDTSQAAEVQAALLPCPFCGSDKVKSGPVTVLLCEVSCKNCEVAMPSWKNQPTWEAGMRDAEAKWNRRANPAAAKMSTEAPALAPPSVAVVPDEVRVERVICAARRYMLAVRKLGEQSGYNNLTLFEAPISKMPNDDLGMEAVQRWRELNDAGKALTAALADADRARLAQPATEATPAQGVSRPIGDPPKRYTQNDLHADDNASYRARYGDLEPRPLKRVAAPAPAPAPQGGDLRAVLAPFLAEAIRLEPNGTDPSIGDSCQTWQCGGEAFARSRITYGDMRRLRAALASSPEPDVLPGLSQADPREGASHG